MEYSINTKISTLIQHSCEHLKTDKTQHYVTKFTHQHGDQQKNSNALH